MYMIVELAGTIVHDIDEPKSRKRVQSHNRSGSWQIKQVVVLTRTQREIIH
jgi:hypothetical protein